MSLEAIHYNPKIATRFRGYFPVVVDVETGGLDPKTDALLEIAAVTLNCDENGIFSPAQTFQHHIRPFGGANIDLKSLEINKIDPDHPFRFAVSEEDALHDLFAKLTAIQKKTGCTRCVLVGHNAWFDLAFLNAAIERTKVKGNPFHAFTSLDTATIGALVYGHTVLAEMLKRAEIPFNNDEHHSAIYDAEQTAKLFCKVINQIPWPAKG